MTSSWEHNGTFATVREVSETSHDIMMEDTISSDAPAMDVDSHGSPREDGGSAQTATWTSPLPLLSQESHWDRLVYPVHPHQHQGHCLELVFSPLRTSSRMSTTRPPIRSGEHSRTSLGRSNRMKSPNLPIGSILLKATQTTCGRTASMPGRLATGQVHELIS